MRIYPHELHPDIGLVDDDQTEDLRPKENAPGGAVTPAEGDQNTHPAIERKF
jgi:hypothetical protein